MYRQNTTNPVFTDEVRHHHHHPTTCHLPPPPTIPHHPPPPTTSSIHLVQVLILPLPLGCVPNLQVTLYDI